MSVYTPLSPSQLRQLLCLYELGEILDFAGISEGIENTNYRIKSTTGLYVLTIFEQYTLADLPYFLRLMAFLRHHGLSVPEPISNTSQQVLMTWQSKPAALFNHLPGKSLYCPEVSHCQQIGAALGQLHNLGQQFPLQRNNEWDLAWMQHNGRQLVQFYEKKHRQGKKYCLDNKGAQLLADELLFQQTCDSHKLPQGVIHADLFRDNVLFDQHRLSGILDFYTACSAPLLYDLAIVVNDWCRESGQGSDSYLNYAKARALISAYEQYRPLHSNEKQNWPVMLRRAALRFWLSRLLYSQAGNAENLPQDKHPDVLKYLLLQHRENKAFCLSLI